MRNILEEILSFANLADNSFHSWEFGCQSDFCPSDTIQICAEALLFSVMCSIILDSIFGIDDEVEFVLANSDSVKFLIELNSLKSSELLSISR